MAKFVEVSDTVTGAKLTINADMIVYFIADGRGGSHIHLAAPSATPDRPGANHIVVGVREDYDALRSSIAD